MPKEIQFLKTRICHRNLSYKRLLFRNWDPVLTIIMKLLWETFVIQSPNKSVSF